MLPLCLYVVLHVGANQLPDYTKNIANASVSIPALQLCT